MPTAHLTNATLHCCTFPPDNVVVILRQFGYDKRQTNKHNTNMHVYRVNKTIIVCRTYTNRHGNFVVRRYDSLDASSKFVAACCAFTDDRGSGFISYYEWMTLKRSAII